jgi:hypothetical protein
MFGAHEQLVHERVAPQEFQAETESEHDVSCRSRAGLDQEDAPERGIGHERRQRAARRLHPEEHAGSPDRSPA